MFLAKICGAIFLLLAVSFPPPSWAVGNCTTNAEIYAGGTLCRCKIGFIENRGMCPRLDLGTAKVRALELRESEPSDCEAMAQILNELSRAVGFNSNTLVSYAGKVLANGIALRLRFVPTLHTIVPAAGQHFAVDFGDDGFRPEYRDGSNQVRHFIAYLSVGIAYPNDSGVRAGFLAELRDHGEAADIALGNLAAALGRQAAGSVHVMENIGRAVRSQVCSADVQ